MKPKRIYLDHASTTPLDPQVFEAMNDAYAKNYFNPGALYAEGVLAEKKISEARKSVAQLLGTTSDHVVFTRGGTESCNLAIEGVLENLTHEVPHVIISAIEHAAVLETVKSLEREGKIDLSIVSVTSEGIIDMDELKKALRPETVLVSVMYVNNEIGTVQPIREIAKLVRWYKKNHPSVLRTAPLSKGSQARSYPLVHTDAIQAANYLDINVERLGVDLMSLSGSKIYGPKSSGVLYVRNRNLLAPLFHGGDQEFGLRSGTEDIAQIVGFERALTLARATSDSESIRLEPLRNYLRVELEENVSGIIINGSIEERVANNVNVTVPGISGERLVIELDARGICAASKSACKEDNGEASHVIAAIRTPQSLAGPRDSSYTHFARTDFRLERKSPYKGEHPTPTDGAVRFTLGRSTSKKDIEMTVKIFGEIVKKIRLFEKSLNL